MTNRFAGWFMAAAALLGLLGCTGSPTCPSPGIVPTDKKMFIGSAACSSCHANIAAEFARHGHSQALKPVTDDAPVYPTGPGVPNPPAGFAWQDISYVLDGYEKAARFVDINGFVLTDGRCGTNTQYNLPKPATNQPGGFVSFLPAQVAPLPFDFIDFSRWTTGPQSFADNGGNRQDHRPGINGTWAQPGVQCEACHGPGSLHIPNPPAGNIDLDPDAQSCLRCHSNPDGSANIAAANGLINGFQQATELAASPHAGFACTVCHDPHASAVYDPATAIWNDCQVCHTTRDMALHKGFVYVQGDYTEPVTCRSCHMPYAVSTLAFNDLLLTNGHTVRLGDTRSHIFFLEPDIPSQADMFTPDGTQVIRNAEGRASLSTCFVCQRCHNGKGNAFAFPPDEGCAFGAGIHVTE